jgi:hypothetical protein
MIDTIGTAYGRVERIDALLGGGARYGGEGATVMDPAGFIALLALTMDDLVVVGHVHLTVAEALDWLIHADTHASIPFVSDDGQTGMIPLRSLARTMPQARLAPTYANAFRARVDRIDAERALGAAADAETRALLALAA